MEQGTVLPVRYILDKTKLLGDQTRVEIPAEQQGLQRYSLSPDDLATTSHFYRYLGERVTLMKYDCDMSVSQFHENGPG